MNNSVVADQAVLSIDHLSKHYGQVRALTDLSLHIERGQVFGLLGPNGSGKTTTLGIILGVLRPKRGTWHWFNQSPTADVLQRVGAILEHPNFFPYLSAVNNLRIVGEIRKAEASEIDEVLKLVNLFERRHHKVQTYSYGMKQRLAIAAALLGHPEVLILDEPTNGLDPSGIVEIRNLIIKVASQGTTVILASHLLDEVQKVCTHVAVLEKGRKLFSGRVEDVLSNTETIELEAADMGLLEQVIAQFPDYVSHTRKQNRVNLKVKSTVDTGLVNVFLHQKGITCTHLSLNKKSLETYFLELLGKESNSQNVVKNQNQ